MKAAHFGRIVNVISTSVKQPISGLGVSNTIRAAVANWSKTLASELGPFGITVNNALPGFTQTVRADYIVQKKSSDSGKSPEQIMEELVKATIVSDTTLENADAETMSPELSERKQEEEETSSEAE